MKEIIDELGSETPIQNLEIYASAFAQSQLIALIHFAQYCRPLKRMFFSGIEISDRFIQAVDAALINKGDMKIVLDRPVGNPEVIGAFANTSRLVILTSEPSSSSSKIPFEVTQIPHYIHSFCQDLVPLHHLAKGVRVSTSRHKVYEQVAEEWVAGKKRHFATMRWYLDNVASDTRQEIRIAEAEIAKIRAFIDSHTPNADDPLNFKDRRYMSTVPQKYLQLFALRTQVVMRVTQRDEQLSILNES